MPTTSPELDTREPRGIIIRMGAPKRAKVPFWAYLWSEEDASGACAAPRSGPILECPSAADALTQSWRASP
jgi:hypothetical protein